MDKGWGWRKIRQSLISLAESRRAGIVDNLPNAVATSPRSLSCANIYHTVFRNAAIAIRCREFWVTTALAVYPCQWVSIARRRMSSVIILSSSPRIYARSPTPVDSSSPLPSTHALLTNRLCQNSPKKFKIANVQRDGFSGFSTARSLLGTKIGAENVKIKSSNTMDAGSKILSPKRFKNLAVVARAGSLTGGGYEVENEDPIRDEMGCQNSRALKKVIPPARSLKRFTSAPSASSPNSKIPKMPDDNFELPGSSPPILKKDKQHRTGDVSRAREAFSPLNIEMAASRRTDWTPTKDTADDLGKETPSPSISRSFSTGLLGSFGYNGDTAVISPTSLHEIDTAPTKRRRLDLIESNIPKAVGKMPAPKTTAVKKPKALPKKNLTITGLATSNYSGKNGEEDEPTLLDEFMATQACDLGAARDGMAREISKTKAAKKQRASKRAPQKSTLVSPTSAMKVFENQDALFGSASQLARDESPSLVCDTLEAIRQSESQIYSSPLRTQETEPISIESATPREKTGLSRYKRPSKLWAAAGRDEDNALLHVDTVDIDSFDTPDLRKAFPGKDALVQSCGSVTREGKTSENLSPSLRGGDFSALVQGELWDIDEMETPLAPLRITALPMVQVRALHTTTRAASPTKRPRSPTLESTEPTEEAALAPSTMPTKKRTPKKPAFAGLATDKLQKQIAAYGFKPMKKREQMIAVLEKCWDQKHPEVKAAPAAQAVPAVEEIDLSLKHGDYLSNVHSLSKRPVPKEKKVPKPRKPKEPKEPKEAKPRKKREPKSTKEKDPTVAKVVRKRKVKAVLSEEKVVDVDDIAPADGNILSEAAATALVDAAIAEATPSRPSPAKVKARAKVIIPRKAKRATTLALASSPAFATPASLSKVTSSPGIPSPPLPVDMDSQISLAITSYTAAAGTNHQRDPTWHEKILLYDPIVLEDLAAWLNTVGLGQIGEDCEVSALEVRAWCEARGVCCLWRGGWRGNLKGGE
jgi:hypothetical protein